MPRFAGWKRFSAPLLAVLLVGCGDTAAEPVEPQPTESKPAASGDSKADSKDGLARSKAELQALLAEIAAAEKNLDDMRRRASDLRLDILRRESTGKTYSIEQLLQGAPYDLNPKTTLEKERFQTWLAENVQGKRLRYGFFFERRGVDRAFIVRKTKANRYQVTFGLHQGFKLPLGDKKIPVQIRLTLGIDGASLELVDRLERLEGKNVSIEMDIHRLFFDLEGFPRRLIIYVFPGNLRINDIALPDAMIQRLP